METLEAIRTRRSIRSFSGRAVPGELVRQLLSSAMSAPSAGNQQPWHFVVIEDRGTLDALGQTGFPPARTVHARLLDRLRPKTTMYLHLTPGSTVARGETHGPLGLERTREFRMGAAE